MTEQEKNLLAELRGKGTLNRQEVEDYVRLIDLESEESKEPVKKEQEEKPVEASPRLSKKGK